MIGPLACDALTLLHLDRVLPKKEQQESLGLEILLVLLTRRNCFL
jgi:hypothetical protein